VDEQLWGILTEGDSEPVLVTYTISEKDAAGPFVKKIPADFRKKAAMESLGYTSPVELLAEKFHMSQQLLRKLNPGASFDKAGQEIVVANVKRGSLPGKVSRIEVDSQQQRVMAYDKDHNAVAIYPATVGSEDRPSPEGEFKVTKIRVGSGHAMAQSSIPSAKLGQSSNCGMAESFAPRQMLHLHGKKRLIDQGRKLWLDESKAGGYADQGSLTEEAPDGECQSFFRSSKRRDDDGRETITSA